LFPLLIDTLSTFFICFFCGFNEVNRHARVSLSYIRRYLRGSVEAITYSHTTYSHITSNVTHARSRTCFHRHIHRRSQALHSLYVCHYD